MIRMTTRGDLKRTEKFLSKASKLDFDSKLAKFGQDGVRALSAATPSDSGETARSWSYKIVKTSGAVSIIWTNTVNAGSAPLAILLQYGHGTRNGGYVQGRDYINPAMRPVFDAIADAAWDEIKK